MNHLPKIFTFIIIFLLIFLCGCISDTDNFDTLIIDSTEKFDVCWIENGKHAHKTVLLDKEKDSYLTDEKGYILYLDDYTFVMPDYFIITVKNKMGILDKDGNFLFPLEYDEIIYANNHFIANKKNSHELYSAELKLIYVNPKVEMLTDFFVCYSLDEFKASNQQNYYIYDFSNNTMIQLDSALTPVQVGEKMNCLCVQNNESGLYGLISIYGTEIIPCEYTDYYYRLRYNSIKSKYVVHNCFYFKNKDKIVSYDMNKKSQDQCNFINTNPDGKQILDRKFTTVVNGGNLYSEEIFPLFLDSVDVSITSEKKSMYYVFSINFTNEGNTKNIKFKKDKLHDFSKIKFNGTDITDIINNNENLELEILNGSNTIVATYVEEYDDLLKYLISYCPDLSVLNGFLIEENTYFRISYKSETCPYITGVECNPEYKNADNFNNLILPEEKVSNSIIQSPMIYENPVISFVRISKGTDTVYSNKNPRTNEVTVSESTRVYRTSSLNEDEVITTVLPGEKLELTGTGYSNKEYGYLNVITQVNIPNSNMNGWIETKNFIPYIYTQSDAIRNNLPEYVESLDSFSYNEWHGPVLQYLTSIFNERNMEQLIDYCKDAEHYGYTRIESDSNYYSSGYYNPLYFAVSFDWKEAFDYIIQNYPKTALFGVNIDDGAYGTPLGTACMKNNYYYVSELLKHGSPVNNMVSSGYHYYDDLISYSEDPRIAQLLKQYGAPLYEDVISYKEKITCKAICNDNQKIKLYSSCDLNSVYTLVSDKDLEGLTLDCIAYEGGSLWKLMKESPTINEEYVTLGRWFKVSNENVEGWLAPYTCGIPKSAVIEWSSFCDGE